MLNDGQFVDTDTQTSYTQNGSNNKVIAELNPFRYRGYYYDSETGLYYLNSRYYEPNTCRFINADDISVLDITKEVFNGLNLYAYCLNNPVMDYDSDGYLPNWLKWLIGGVVIVGLTIATIATGGVAGGVAGFVLAGALKGAVIGAVSGAIVSGAVSGISSVLSGGNFWTGFANGAADGFMFGAIVGGITGAITSGVQVANAAKYWDKGTFKSGFQSMKYHYSEHVVRQGFKQGNNIIKYTQNAVDFMNRNANLLRFDFSEKYNMIRWIYSDFTGMGYYSSLGKIITFILKG